MRIGNNPEKDNIFLKIDSYHRIVIPVYIPNLEDDYFKDAFVILKLCIESLLKTIHDKSRVSIINNGSCDEVGVYLNDIYIQNSLVDQLINSKINLGKVNAIYAAVKSNLEPLITISDSDVMFLTDWQVEVEKLFNDFPAAGMVAPVPSSLGYRPYFLNSTYYYGFFKGKIGFSKVENSLGLIRFQESIGRELYNEHHLDSFLTIQNHKSKAVIGCGHFVATMRAEVFKKSPNYPTNIKITGNSEGLYFDIPNDKAGFLRLATMNNHAYHLGNTYEDWMQDEFQKIKNASFPQTFLSKPLHINQFKRFIGKILYTIFIVKLKKYYFKLLGMSKDY